MGNHHLYKIKKCQLSKTGKLAHFIAILTMLFVSITPGLAQLAGPPQYFNSYTTTQNNSLPLGNNVNNKIQAIYGPGVFTTTGAATGTISPSGMIITDVHIRIQSTANATATYDDFEISLAQNVGTQVNFGTTTNTSYPFNTGMTTVFYQQQGFQLTGAANNTWIKIPLQTPFLYNPNLSLVLEIRHNGYVGSTSNNGLTVNSVTGNMLRIFGPYSSTTGSVNVNAPLFGITLGQLPSCTTAVAGNTLTDKTIACPTENINLSISGNTSASGQSYQWQSSVTGNPGTWTDIANATLQTYTTNPSNTLWYRNVVTCGTFSDTSTPVLVTVNSTPLNGNYTINSSLPASATNFQSFTAAVAELHCAGVSGPVVFNVAAGTYTEQIEINNITGASPTNTITFKGADPATTKLTFAQNVDTERYTIRFNNASWIILDSLAVEADDFGMYGWTIHLNNDANNIIIRNCSLLASTTTITSHILVINANASNNQVNSGGNTANHITIENNVISGGYTSMRFNGAASSHLTNIFIENNKIENAYHYGIYLNFVEKPLILGNNIEMRTAGNNPSSSAIHLIQVRFFYVNNNYIKDMGQYGIFVQSSMSFGSPSSISNNSIGGGFRNLSAAVMGGGIRIVEGTNTNPSGYIDIYNNSINVDAGINAALRIGGLVSNINVKNNSFVYSGPDAGYAMHITSPSSLLTLNNNNYYSTGTSFVHYGGTDLSDLFSLQNMGIPTGNDLNSVSGDPGYTTSQNLMPQSCLLNNMGTPIYFILQDIVGTPRNQLTPDIGAYEFSPIVLPSPTSASVEQCLATGIQLIASSIDPLAEFYWYDSLSRGSLLHVGDTFITPVIAKGDSMIFFVETRINTGFACPSERTAVTAKVLGNPVASIQPGAVFQGQFSIGGLGNFDQACAGDTLMYELFPPIGMTNADFGTEWIVTNFQFETSTGIPAIDTALTMPTTTSNSMLTFVPAYNEGDSVFELSITILNLVTGCDTVIQRFVNIAPTPEPTFTAADICDGNNMNFNNTTIIQGAGTVNYLWNFGDNNTSTTENPQHIYAAAGNYHVTLTATSTQGCKDSVSQSFTVFEMPEAEFSVTGNCANDEIEFSNQSVVHSGPHSYVWNFGKNNDTSSAENPTYFYGAQGSYPVTLTVDNNGCRDSFIQIVDILAAPMASFTASEFCEGSATIFNNTTSFLPGSINYEWNIDGNTVSDENPSYTFATAGNYIVTLNATQQNGCSDMFMDTVSINPLPDAGFTPTLGIMGSADFQATETGHASYIWNFGDGNTATGATTNHTYTLNGTYNVKLTVTSADGCIDSSLQTISVINVSSSLPLITNGSLKIHPNPYSGSTNISYELPSAANVVLAVYNVEGKLVQQLVNTRQQSGNHTYSFSGSDAGFGPGMYLVRLIVDGKLQIQRVIEMR